MKPLRVLLLVHDTVVPPPDAAALPRRATWDYQMELDVLRTLRDLGHDVLVQGVGDELRVMLDAIARHRPHVVFNVLSYFRERTANEANLVALLELCGVPTTGCNARGIVLAGDKALSRELLAAHGVPHPAFAVFPPRRTARSLPPPLAFPVLVKTAAEHGSAGIAQASVVRTPRQLAARVALLHRDHGGDVLAEQFLPGREFSVGVLDGDPPRALPVTETWFTRLPVGQHAIVTERCKWDERHQRRVGLRSGPARRLASALRRTLQQLALRSFRALRLSGYARIDFRLDGDGKPHAIDVNVNPDLSIGEDFPAAAARAGLSYPRLVQHLLDLARRPIP